MAIEYDYHELIKWKNFQKIVQIKPDVAIAITGNGNLGPNLERATLDIKTAIDKEKNVKRMKELMIEALKDPKVLDEVSMALLLDTNK